MASALPPALVSAAREATVPGFGLAEALLVTLGPRGCVLASADCVPRLVQVDIDMASLVHLSPALPVLTVRLDVSEGLVWYRLLRPLSAVRDVTGAGDALLAGAASAFVAGWPLEEAVLAGLAAAHTTLFVDGAVAQQLHQEFLPKLAMQLSDEMSESAVELTKDAIIHVAQVPSEWSAEELRQLHQSLVIEEFQNVKIMPSSDGGITRHAYLQYRTAAAAWSAVKRLSGNLVHVSGGVRQLAAELSAPETQVSGPEPERYLNGNKPRPQAPQGPGAPVAPGPGGPGGSRVPKEKARSAFEPGPNHDPFTLYLSDMPSDFSKQDLDRLHDHLNLRKPKSIKVVFLRLKKGKSSAILRYETTEQAKEALTMLHDRVLLVNEHSGEEQHPRAQYAKRRASDAMYQEEEGSHAGSDHEEEAMYSLPSVYLAELPVNITDNGVRHILQEVGANLEDLVTITFLQQKNKGSHICCLLRYHNLETAEAVANLLHGFRVYHPDDRTRPVRAKVAKHAKNFNPVCTEPRWRWDAVA
ncbi:unnamed protein product [Effrenium voratum]|nr:unnamed protein product [Effrenium voratum]